jgi:hypothetical protein
MKKGKIKIVFCTQASLFLAKINTLSVSVIFNQGHAGYLPFYHTTDGRALAKLGQKLWLESIARKKQ